MTTRTRRLRGPIEQSLRSAQQLGMIDEGTLDIADAAREAGLIVVS